MATVETALQQLFDIPPAKLTEYSKWAFTARKHPELFSLSGMSQASILTLSAIAGLVESGQGNILGDQLKNLSKISPEKQGLIYRFYVQDTLSQRGVDVIYLEPGYNGQLPPEAQPPLISLGYQLGADHARLAFVRPGNEPGQFFYRTNLLVLPPKTHYEDAISLLFASGSASCSWLDQNATSGTHEALIFEAATAAVTALHQAA